MGMKLEVMLKQTTTSRRGDRWLLVIVENKKHQKTDEQ